MGAKGRRHASQPRKGYRAVAAKLVEEFKQHGDIARLEDDIESALQAARTVYYRKSETHAVACRRRYRERIARGFCGRCGTEPICDRSRSYGERCLDYLKGIQGDIAAKRGAQ